MSCPAARIVMIVELAVAGERQLKLASEPTFLRTGERCGSRPRR
jgi:hypothetical protein